MPRDDSMAVIFVVLPHAVVHVTISISHDSFAVLGAVLPLAVVDSTSGENYSTTSIPFAFFKVSFVETA